METQEILSLFPRGHMEPFMVDVVLFREGKGYFSESRILEELMTPGDLAAYRADYAEMEAFEAGAKAAGILDDGEHAILYLPTAELAAEHMRLINTLHYIDEDMRAFHAPSECYPLAARGIPERLHEIERLSTNRRQPEHI